MRKVNYVLIMLYTLGWLFLGAAQVIFFMLLFYLQTRNFQPTSNQRQRKAAMESIYRVMFLISFGFCLISCSEITIYIGGFVELSTQGGWNSAGILPAIELATKHINRQPNILKDIELRVDMKDSKVGLLFIKKNVFCINARP